MIRQLIAAVTLLILTSAAVAQTAGTEQTTGNLVYTSVNPAPAGTNIGSTWSGFSVVNSTGGNTTGDNGAVTGYNPSTGTFMFGYNQGTIAYTYAINQALANSGSGIVVQGYNWSWDINNNNFDNRQGSTDTLTARIITFAPNNIDIRRTDTWTYNTRFDWTTFGGTVNYVTPGSPSEFGNMRIEFTGRDSGFWAGYYGPMVRNIDVRLNYTVAPVDPCVANPQSSPSCPGYTLISDNLVPWPNHWTTNGQSINQTYAINQALSAAGAGVVIHGFNYGYQYNLGSSWSQCTATNQDGSCSWTMTFNPRVDVNLSIRSNTNTQIHGITHTEIAVNTGNQRRDFQYRFASPRDILTLGNFNFSASTSFNATVFGMYSRAAYVIDECVANPLSSNTCPGYAQAYLDQQCSANTLYSSQCPGYAQAYFDQQCGLNTLYDPACPGYAQAFYNYQCSLNALYHTGCPGYAAAYFDQQCGLDPFYNTSCPGYAQAYFDQQCGLDPLYNNQCPGYTQAYALKFVINAPSTNSTPVAEETVAIAAAAASETVTAVTESVAPAATVSAAEPAAPVQLVSAPAPAATTAAAAAPATTRTEPAAAPAPRTTRQAVAEQRAAAAREQAAQQAQENPGAVTAEMDAAGSFEQQTEIQNVVLGAMGFVAGFDAYGRVTLPDGVGYRPFEIYPGQRNIDTPAARGLIGRSDRIHEEMVNEQYR